VSDQPKRNSSSDDEVGVHVAPSATCVLVTYVVALPPPPDGSGIDGLSKMSTSRQPMRPNIERRGVDHDVEFAAGLVGFVRRRAARPRSCWPCRHWWHGAGRSPSTRRAKAVIGMGVPAA
jgi:hypothetical protein